MPLILAMACGHLGTGNTADRPSTAGPADNRPNRDPIPTAGGANIAVLSPLRHWPFRCCSSPVLDMVRSSDASGRRAVVRTLALPLSFLFLGLGFAGILLGDRRRALHDVIAGTAVIYSWDARAARLRFLSRG